MTKKATDEEKQILKLLEQIQENTAVQRTYAQKQYRLSCIHTAATIILLLCMLITLICFAPRIEQILTHADIVLANFEEISNGLVAADIPGTINKIDGLVEQTSEGVDQALGDLNNALKPIEEVDVQALNEAIRDLRSTVAPMARFFGGKK